MKLAFTKMEGCGNDYIYVDGFSQQIPTEQKADLARRLSDRHFGIGADGLIFINPSAQAVCEMEMYNADGSRSEMCGNGIRCVARFAYDNKITRETDFAIESMGVDRHVHLFLREGEVTAVEVDMGRPILEAARIPVEALASPVLGETIVVGGQNYEMTCVSMGNPHCVVFVPDVEAFPLEKIGPQFESHPRFPKRVNAEFVRCLDEETLQMRVWERGTGETLACGTGCCATAVAAVLNHRTGRKVKVLVPGGTLFVRWEEETDHVYLTGPATPVFSGEIEI